MTVFTHLGVRWSARKTVAGLLVLLTTVTELVLPVGNLSVRVFTQVVKTLTRVVVLTSTSPGPETSDEKLATVFMLRKTSGGQMLQWMLKQRQPSIEFLLQTLTLRLAITGTPLTTTLKLTGISSTGLNPRPTVRQRKKYFMVTTTRHPQLFLRRKSRVNFALRMNPDMSLLRNDDERKLNTSSLESHEYAVS